MNQTDFQTPCLVDTGRGFSVYYQNRFLYSKYAPKKTIVNALENLKILPGTIFLISSPLLWHGLEELLENLPEKCFVLAFEKDFELYARAEKSLKEKIEKNPELKIAEKVKLLSPEKIPYIVNIILNQNIEKKDEIPPVYNFRRVIHLEFSGGSALNKEFYQNITLLAQNAIGSFWKNRLTLTRLGRLYSRNIFKNLENLPNATDFSQFEKKIEKPIFIFGAGESTVETLKIIRPEELQKCFVLCVDAALPVLSAFKIIPNAVVAVEGQLAIEKAYIGNAELKSFIFADMASRKQVLSHSKNFSYFASEYSRTNFLETLKKQRFFPKTIPALGSVGLTASYLALELRKSEEIPVFAAGLDFDFSLGKTHAQNAPAHILRLVSSNRLKKIANYDSAFKNGAFRLEKVNGTDFFTDISLS
ncbi:MAG: 6-hydroxymethylpterin diphosphokinase MptE-like protein, partial [Treponema sp.]|nr:6-hydroxymethylpterin diphosphokinase MptE-like protein [Treponema sp.]